MKFKLTLRRFLLLAAATLPLGLASAQTAHNWSGATSSDPTVAGNWSAGGVPAFGTSPLTINGRINLQNGANNQLVYSSAQGHSIFTGQSNRALGSGANTTGNAMSVTGGILELRGTAPSFLGVNNGAGSHTLSVDGGEVRAANSDGTGFQGFIVGFNNSNDGILTINSGEFNAGNITFGNSGTLSTKGTVNLNGGTLTISNFAKSGADVQATVNFDGGNLKARSANANFLPTTITTAAVKAGGANINTNSFNITIAKALTADDISTGGGLTLNDDSTLGNGTLTLSGVNTYTGATTITRGTLALTGSIANSSTINVGTGATLNVSAVSGWTVGSSQTVGGTGTIVGNTIIEGTLSPGQSPGTLAFDNNLSIATAATYFFEGGDLTTVGGTLNLNNDWILALGTGLQDGGSIALFAYDTAGTFDLTPGFDLTSLGFMPGSSLTLTDTGSEIVLNGVSIIPEPAAALLGSLGMFFLLRRRR